MQPVYYLADSLEEAKEGATKFCKELIPGADE